jgi:hypothetical protein
VKATTTPALLVKITDHELIGKFYAWTLQQQILPLDGTLQVNPGFFLGVFDLADSRPIRRWLRDNGGGDGV